jgi:hypothetical protein
MDVIRHASVLKTMFVRTDIVASKNVKAKIVGMMTAVEVNVMALVQMARLVVMECVVRVKIIIVKVLTELANASLTVKAKSVEMMDVAIVAELALMVNIVKMENAVLAKAYVLQQ